MRSPVVALVTQISTVYCFPVFPIADQYVEGGDLFSLFTLCKTGQFKGEFVTVHKAAWPFVTWIGTQAISVNQASSNTYEG